jgi:hypothetical protein
MIYVGIDPGKDGAIALYGETSRVEFVDMPLVVIGKTKKGSKRTRVDWVQVVKAIEDIAGVCSDVHFIIEDLKGIGKALHTGTGQFNFARDYGVILGVVSALKLRYTLVSPEKWQKAVGAGKLESSSSYVLRAQQLFPHAELIPPGCKKPRDGRAAALMMAYFGYLQHNISNT